MTPLTIEFTFHNVGQGLFYSGKVGRFNFIYDCGAEKRKHLYTVIGNYRNYKLPSSKLDLLILSHLHDDHVIGLNVLLSEISVDTVILPYLTPIERLMVASRRKDLSLWFYEFLADPTSFLIEKGAEKVVLLGGREAHSPERVSSESEERRFDPGELLDDKGLRKEVLENDPQLERFLDQGNLLVKNHREPLKVRGIWFFRFFNCKVEDSKKNLFRRCVKSTIGKDNLIDVIKSKSKLRNLKTCYDNLQKDFNDTSLVVYHAPIDRSEYLCKAFGAGCQINDLTDFMFAFPHKHITHLHEANGHFLTGDINLRNNWDEIRIHYGFYLLEVAVALLPHHGSKRSWNRAILTRLPHKCTWVASSGVSNRYGHPNYEVIQDAIHGGSILYWCNELNKISIKCLPHKKHNRLRDKSDTAYIVS